MAKHTPDGDTGFTMSLVKHGAAAVALVLVVAGAFWGVGQIRDTEADPAAAPATDGTDTATTPATDDVTAPADTPTATAPTTTATATTAPTATAAPQPTETQAPAASIDPASISVQILDAVLDDAGVGAQGWRDQLEADGYDVVVINQSSRVYETTTVFFTPGNEAAAQQIADQYGFDEVALRPDNLSDTVDIHLVIGRDA